jgi:hypothetical protein
MVAAFTATFTMSSPPPPDIYQLRQAYWGNPHATAISNNDRNNDSNYMPTFADVSAAVAVMSDTTDSNNESSTAGIVDNSNNNSDNVPSAAADVSASITDVNPVVANVNGVVANIDATANSNNGIVGGNNDNSNNVPSDAANVSAAITNVITAVADVNHVIADVVDVSANFNHATTPYNNLMSAARPESTGQSVDHSNVTGINNEHMRWIQQCMNNDWGIQAPTHILE